jgi:hypothetical protein
MQLLIMSSFKKIQVNFLMCLITWNRYLLNFRNSISCTCKSWTGDMNFLNPLLWIVEQLLWLICLLSTYPKLDCDHYYYHMTFLKPNKNFTIANSADIWLSFSQVDTREVARLFNCHQSTVVSNHEQCVRSSSARTTDQQDRRIQIQHLV